MSAIDTTGQRTAQPQGSTQDDLEDLHRKARAARNRFEPTWFMSLAYYKGDQWLAWDGRGLYRPKLRSDRLTLTDNRIIGIVRTEVAKMTKTRPIFVATPTTDEDEDVAAAKTSERVLNYLWTQILDLTRKQRAALLWSRVCGAGFWKVCWDQTKGDTIEVLVDQGGQPLTRADGRPLRPTDMPNPPEGIDQKTLGMGEVAVEVRSPFEIYPDPLAGEEGLSSAEWLIDETVQSQEYVKRRYDVDVEPDAEAIPGVSESRMPGVGQESVPAYKGVRVKELWMQPSSEYPNGRHVVWNRQGTLYREDNNPYKDLPYVMFGGIGVPGRFWPTSMTEQLVSPQTELNKLESQVAENRNRIANPPLLWPRSAGERRWDGKPGEVLDYDNTMPNSIPAWLQAPEIPAYVQNEFARIEGSFREISGQHEVTSGSVPTGVTAASAINLLQEQDDTRLGPDITEMERSIAEAGTRILDLVAKYYTDERTIRIAGDDDSFDIFSFRGAMLKGNTRVEVQAGSAMPRSKAAKTAAMQDILNLFLQYGIPIPDGDLREYLSEMEVGGVEKLVSHLSKDQTQVNRENRQLSHGQPVPLNTYDNDGAHISLHEEYQKGHRYAQLDPMAQQAFEQHVSLHRQRVQQKQMDQQQQQMQLQLQSQPQPPGNGQPALPRGGSQ